MISQQILPEAGARVGVVDGPGVFPKDNAGTVITQVTDRWGSHAVVMMDSGKIAYCHGLTKVGIGYYLLA